MIISRGEKLKKIDFKLTIDGPGEYFIKEIDLMFVLSEITVKSGENLKYSRNTALLDADKIKYPIIVRNFQPGDRFIPLGLGGHKKIKDFFIDQKLPSEKRKSIPNIM